jgi:transposase
LKLSRDTIERCQKTEYALVSSLQRDPVLADRIKRLRTVPGVGPITARTWALEIGDVSRFGSIKEAISYWGLCGEERSSARQGDAYAAFEVNISSVRWYTISKMLPLRLTAAFAA